MERQEIIEQVQKKKIIAILRGLNPDSCLETAKALQRGGIQLMEVTFDPRDMQKQQDTIKSIQMIREYFGQEVLVGAGTVVSPRLVQMAAQAGACYIISPDTDREVIEKTRQLRMVSMPGALTPTEISNAQKWGADFVKLFPAGNFGPEFIKAIKAPLSHVRLLAVGGVHAGNAAEFLKAGCCGLGAGGNLVNKKWIQAGEYEKLTEAARELVTAVQSIQAQSC